MLLSLLLNFSLEGLLAFLLLLPALLFSLSAHEYAHGYAAFKQGDSFAKNTGRLTLNPFKHIDPIGFICMLLVGFGWAKPVPIVPGNFRNGRKSMLIVSLAGVLTNLFLAFFALNLWYFLIVIFKVPMFSPTTVFGSLVISKGYMGVLEQFLYYFVTINLTLCVFNLIPIPPLDGYKVVREFFCTWKNQRTFDTIERYGTIILLIVLISGFGGGIISTVSDAIFKGFNVLLNLVYNLA